MPYKLHAAPVDPTPLLHVHILMTQLRSLSPALLSVYPLLPTPFAHSAATFDGQSVAVASYPFAQVHWSMPQMPFALCEK